MLFPAQTLSLAFTRCLFSSYLATRFTFSVSYLMPFCCSSADLIEKSCCFFKMLKLPPAANRETERRKGKKTKTKKNQIGSICFLQYGYTHGEHGGDIRRQQFVSLFCSQSHDCSRRLLGNNRSVKAKGTYSRWLCTRSPSFLPFKRNIIWFATTGKQTNKQKTFAVID